jgi:uncharacterized protein (UPF0147 family)
MKTEEAMFIASVKKIAKDLKALNSLSSSLNLSSEGADFLSESIDDALSILEEISEDVTMEIKNRS